MQHWGNHFEALRWPGKLKKHENGKASKNRPGEQDGLQAHINGRGGLTRESKGSGACGKLLGWPRKSGSSKQRERLLDENKRVEERRRSTVAGLVRS